MGLTKQNIKTETDKIMEAVNFMLEKQGYIDITLVSKMVLVPSVIIENVIKKEGFRESNIRGQYIKNAR